MGAWQHAEEFAVERADADGVTLRLTVAERHLRPGGTRMDPVRDTLLVENTPIDYLDFASPVSGLGGKMGLDATNKWPGETAREWGRAITMDAAVRQRVASLVAGLLPG